MSAAGWWPRLRPGDLVGSLEEDELARLLAVTEVADVDVGSVIMHKDAPSRSLILVEEGELEVAEDGPTGRAVLGVAGPGDVVGDVGFVDGAVRTHDVVARTPCRLRRLPRATVMELASSDPVLFGKLAMGLAEILAHRFRTLVEEMGPMRAYVATVARPADPTADTLQFDELEDIASMEPLDLLRCMADKANKGMAGM